MLDALRRSASGWAAKILLSILVVSFVVAWGAGDSISRVGRQKLAVVGGREITIFEFQREYQNQLGQVSQQIGRRLTSAEARQLKVAERVLDNLVGSTAVSMHAEKLGLGISEKVIADDIVKDTSFRGADGKFSRPVFEEILQNMGLSEAGFVELQRQEMVRNQIIRALTSTAYAPDTLVKALYQYQNDQRSLKYFVVPVAAAGKVDAPDEAVIKTYYDEHKNEFRAPEYRKISMILLSVEAMKAAIPVSDDEIKAAYEATKKKYGTPELRTIEQLSFKDKAAALDAKRKLDKGSDFLKLGEELGLKEGDIKLGAFAREKFADAKVAEAAFALKKNEVSDVVEGYFPVLVRVTAIEPGTQKSLDDVKSEIRDALAKTHASDFLSKLYDDVENDRKKGASLAEIAEKRSLKLEEPTFDQQGIAPDGKPVESVAKHPEIVKLAFESDVGLENNPVGFSDGNAFVDVREIIVERQRPLDEVRDQIKKSWIEAEVRNRIIKKADELVAKVSGGEKIEAVAESVDAKVVKTPLLKRNGAQPGLQLSTITMAFTLPEGGASWAQTADLKTRLVFQVAETKSASDPDPKQLEQLRAEMRMSVGLDMVTQYVNGLQASYGVTTNTKVISDLVSSEQ